MRSAAGQLSVNARRSKIWSSSYNFTILVNNVPGKKDRGTATRIPLGPVWKVTAARRGSGGSGSAAGRRGPMGMWGWHLRRGKKSHHQISHTCWLGANSNLIFWPPKAGPRSPWGLRHEKKLGTGIFAPPSPQGFVKDGPTGHGAARPGLRWALPRGGDHTRRWKRTTEWRDPRLAGIWANVNTQ